MNAPFLNPMPWRRFMEFISPKAERYNIIKELLEEADLEYNVLDLAGSRHLVVIPRQSGNKFLNTPPPTILVAHYDRVEGSPGANDNSVGVFLLIETAVKFKKLKEMNWVIIFTDKEELKPGESLLSQGSYALAASLKSLKMENSKIFCFDACGNGDTLIVSTTIEYLLKKEGGREKQLESVMVLRNYALEVARNLGITKIFLAPTLFSDDAGFFRGGLAAQTITMLPSAESSKLLSELRRNQKFTDVLINAELRHLNGSSLAIPNTWRCLNTPKDSHLRLTPRNFRTVVRFAEALCRS